MEEVLNERKQKILKAIIKTYMETGEPVGSRTISKYADLNVSSAKIRNEMSDLTDRSLWYLSPCISRYAVSLSSYKMISWFNT